MTAVVFLHAAACAAVANVSLAASKVPLVKSAALWLCDSGVLASVNRASFPSGTVVPVWPVGMRSMDRLPDVMSDAAWAWVELAAPMSDGDRASVPPVACEVLWADGVNVLGTFVSCV
jgi:hypothetical protein